MSTGAADGFLRSIYEGCISGCDIGVERRPYHRNCQCALHDKSWRGIRSHACLTSKKVSYPMKRSWGEGCLTMVAASGYSSLVSVYHEAGKQQPESYKD